LANLPVARAKSRTWRGLTIATAIPAAASALATRHLQAACRFKNHKVSRLELPEQLADSNLVVSNRKSLSVRPDEHFQLRLGNVDPNKPFLITHLLTSSAWLAPPCNPELNLYSSAVDNVFSPPLAAQPRRILCGYAAPRRVGDDRIAQQWNHGGG
jgi:hypothetical protein